ncbi:MAG: hypothetical protein NW206_17825 [Hyphomonadaceae bacterium]|nr:hypothetical protein [Hyphomonadaceae bacterium]
MDALVEDSHQRNVIQNVYCGARSDDVAAIISEASDRKITHHVAPDEALAEMMLRAGVPEDFVPVLARDQVAMRTGFAAEVATTVVEVTGIPREDSEPSLKALRSFEERVARPNHQVFARCTPLLVR